jgi:hypothetical protein
MAPRDEPQWLTWTYIGIGFFIFLFAAVLVQLLFASWPFFLLLGIGLLGGWALFWSPRAQAEKAKAELQALYATVKRAINSAALPATDDFERDVLERVSDRVGNYPPYVGLANFLEVPAALYRGENLHAETLLPPPETTDKVILGRYKDVLNQRLLRLYEPKILASLSDPIVESIEALLSELPSTALSTREEIAACADGSLTPPAFFVPIGEMLENPGETVERMILPFYATAVRDQGLFRELREQLDRNVTDAKDVMPSDSKAPAADVVRQYLRGTPLAALFEAQVPFQIPEATRFRHQWIVGDTGAGKTTFISSLLMDDFARVARNEASVFVMDSQNELIPDIARLQIFAPGQPLYGKLVYLEPDPDFPLGLNIFDVDQRRLSQISSKDRMMMESGAMWMVEFFLSSLVKADASPHQDTFLNYLVPALLAIPDATIMTFKDLLEDGGYDRHKEHFSGLREDTQRWLANRLHSKEVAVTRNAIRARLDGFTARPIFHDMFAHPRNRFDLFAELQESKVILINTMGGLLKTATQPFGRYFIARLLQAAEERMFLARGNRLPVFAYIDEAADYIAEEQNVEELMSKARKQNVGLIFANQRPSQITSPTVRDALARAAIQCQGTANTKGPPTWTISLDRGNPVKVAVPNVRFQDMLKMTGEQHAALMADMRVRYSVIGTKHPETVASKPQREEPTQAPSSRTGDTDDGTKPGKW